MRNFIWTITAVGLGLAGFTASAPANAESASTEETIGVGTGGLIGAVAGGPVGFMIGAAIGAKIGDTLHQKDERIETLTATVDQSQHTIDDLESDVERLQANVDAISDELARVQRVSKPELVDLMQKGIELDLLFRTDEHVLKTSTGSRLTELAQTLAGMSNVQVQLDGFADERGATDYNQQLSEKRVDYVRERLIEAGIDPTRISTTAHGESRADDDRADSLALERRVSVRLYIDDSPSFASNPD